MLSTCRAFSFNHLRPPSIYNTQRSNFVELVGSSSNNISQSLSSLALHRLLHLVIVHVVNKTTFEHHTHSI
jgi:hypothetical protein